MQSRPIKFRAWDRLTKTMFEPMDLRSSYARLNGFGSQGYELMQYTGLKDKNGKGIYEGDIVKASYRNTPQVVEWIAKYAGFSIGGAMPERPVNSDFTDWEIIGNIYENPELLN